MTANHLYLAPDRSPRQHLITQFFTGWSLFLMPSQQCQSTEGKHNTQQNSNTYLTILTVAKMFLSYSLPEFGIYSQFVINT